LVFLLLKGKGLFIILQRTLLEIEVLRLALQSYLFLLDSQPSFLETVLLLLVAELFCRDLVAGGALGKEKDQILRLT
jgi:hypothetical protein